MLEFTLCSLRSRVSARMNQFLGNFIYANVCLHTNIHRGRVAMSPAKQFYYGTVMPRVEITGIYDMSQ